MRPLTLPLFVTALLMASASVVAADPRTDAHGDSLPDGALARLGSVRWRAGSAIGLAAFLPDGKSVLTVSQDYMVQVWDRDNGKELNHFDAAGAASTDANAARFVLLNANGSGVALSRDGKVLACAGRDAAVHLWDVGTSKETAKVADLRTAGRAQLALSGDGKTLVVSVYGQKTTVWDTATGKEVRSFGEATPTSRLMPYHAALSPDGKALVQVGYEVSRAVQTAVVVWDVTTGKELRRVSDFAPGGGSLPGMMSAVTADAKLVAVPVGDKVKLIDTAAGKVARDLDGGGAQSPLAFSPDGKLLVALHGNADRLTVWDVAAGKKVRDVGQAPAGGVAAAAGVVNRFGALLSVSPDGKLLAWGAGSALRLTDLETGKDRNASAGHAGAPLDVLFARDGKTVLTGGDDGTLRRWDAATGKQLGEVALPAKSYAFIVSSPDGRWVAAGEQAGTVHLIDAATGKEKHAIAPIGPGGWGTSVAFSPDSRRLAVVNQNSQTVEIYDAASGESRQSLALAQAQQVLPGGGVVLVGARGQRRLAFSPEGRTLAVTDGSLVLFDLAAGREERRIELPQTMAVRYVAYSPDGRTVAVEMTTGQVELLEVASGQKRLTLNAAKAGPVVTSRGGVAIVTLVGRAAVLNPVTIAFSPDGHVLAQADGSKARLWDLYTGKEAGSFDGHRGLVAGLAFAPEGRRLATAGADTTALIWDATPAVKKLPALPAPLKKDKLDSLWGSLASNNGATAFEAIRDLAGDPAAAVPFLAERVKAVTPPETARVAKLIADLDSDDFDVREAAAKELAKLGELIVGPAHEALKNHPSAEQKRALEEIVKAAASPAPSAERLRTVRALEALEMAHSPEAVKLLRQVAGGAADTLPTRQARAALERLGEK